MTLNPATETAKPEVTSLAIITTVPGFMEAAQIISGLRVKYDGVTYDVSTAIGMAKAIAARKELRDARIALDKRKPEVKREALDFCNKVESDYKAIRAAVSEYEDIPDAAIKAEEDRKEQEKAEKARIAAEAQAVLDNKILEIAKLPMRCVNMPAEEISAFIALLEEKPIGGEFTGETRVRAEAAKAEALEAIRLILADATAAEAEAARIKEEQKAAAVLLETERIEREKEQAAFAEEKRKHELEQAEIQRLRDIETEKFNAEKKAFEEEQARVAAEREESARVTKEKQDAIDAEAKRVQDEADAKKRNEERLAAIVAEKQREETEKARRVEARARKLAEAKCATAKDALKKILDICRQTTIEPRASIEEITTICEGNL